MDKGAREFFVRLLETPSPSGYERDIQDVVRAWAGEFADEVRTDSHGNVIAAINADAPLRVLFAGHCDQIGLLVSYIDDRGFLYTQTVGGWDPQQLVGQRMTVWTKKGPLPAVISRKPIHLLEDEERKQVVKAKNLWLDIGAKSKDEAKELVRIGDPVTLALGFQEMRNGFANAPGMDDKTGLWVVMEAARRIRARSKKKKLQVAVFAVSTVQEEIGLRGARTSAYGIDPHLGIAVDVTHATDCPTIDKNQEGDVRLGGGPVITRGPNMSPVVCERLIAVAEKKKIPYQLAALGRAAGNDANSIQLTRAGVATGHLGVPNRYMHSAVEMISLADLDHCAELLCEVVMDLRKSEDLTP
jgi:endoglucanase